MNLLHYIKGIRKGKDAHRLELQAMRDPFLHDAMEGYDDVSGNHAGRISRMQDKIRNRTAQKRQFPVWAAAAGLALLLGTGAYFLLPRKDSRVLVSQEMSLPTEPLVGEKGNEAAASESVVNEESSSAVNGRNAGDDISSIEQESEKMISPHLSEDMEIAADELHLQKAEMAASSDDMAVNEEYKSQEVADEKAYIPTASPTPWREMGTENSISVKNAGRSEAGKMMAAESSGTAAPQAQTARNVLKGKVIDTHGKPVIGAIVQQKNAGPAAITDMDGNFTLRVDSLLNDAIAVSSIGYQSQEMKINHLDNNLLIAMHEDNHTLNEVVVSGYGASKRSDMKGTVQSVKKESTAASGMKKDKPEPVMGIAAYKDYLKNNISRPADEKCAQAKGKVILTFYVNESGKPYDIKVKKSLCPSADSIAVGLLRNGGNWTHKSRPTEIEVTFKGK